MFNISHLNTGFKFSFIGHLEYKQHMHYCVTWNLNIKYFQTFFHLDNWMFKILLGIMNGITVNLAFCHSKHILSALLHLIRLNTQENCFIIWTPLLSLLPVYICIPSLRICFIEWVVCVFVCECMCGKHGDIRGKP